MEEKRIADNIREKLKGKNEKVEDKPKVEYSKEYLYVQDKVKELLSGTSVIATYPLFKDMTVSFKVPTVFEYGLFLEWIFESMDTSRSINKFNMEMSLHSLAFHLVDLNGEAAHELSNVNFYEKWMEATEKCDEIMSNPESDEDVKLKASSLPYDIIRSAKASYSKKLDKLNSVPQTMSAKLVQAFKKFSSEYLTLPYEDMDNEDNFDNLPLEDFIFNPNTEWKSTCYNSIECSFVIPTIRELRVLEDWIDTSLGDKTMSQMLGEHKRSIYYLSGTLKVLNNVSFIPKKYFSKLYSDLDDYELLEVYQSSFDHILGLPLPIVALIESSREHLERKINQMMNDGSDLKN